MAYEIEVAVLKAQPMLSIQASTTPDQIAEVLGQLFGKITALANKRQAQIAGQPFTRYHAFDEKTVVLEAGIPVVTAVEGEGEIKSGELPAGAAAMTIGRPHSAMPGTRHSRSGLSSTAGPTRTIADGAVAGGELTRTSVTG